MADSDPISDAARPRRQRGGPAVMPWKWVTLTVLVYAIAGVLLAAFSPPVWVWPLALAGTLAQALALAGPQALRRLSRRQARGAVLLSCLGTGMLMVGLAIAIGYGGTDDIDAISLGQTAVTVAGVSLGALLLTAACALLGAQTGDGLVVLFDRSRSGIILAGVCFLGLLLGGLVGVVTFSLS